MARSNPSRPAPRGPRTSSPAPTSKTATTATAAAPRKGKDDNRETVEAIVVAFILALLVRGFEAEAFVIPTGSMAPTLMGRHKETTCPQCGYVFTINAADEVEGYSGGDPASRRIVAGVCLNCRYQSRVNKEPSFKGDRILVMKFPYEMPFLPGSSGPKRWDVVVFRFPENPDENYIKRLVGLPGETIRIWYGDIYVKAPGSDQFTLQRKPLYHQQAMQMMVYDDHHRPSLLKDKPEWLRWGAATQNAWAEDATKPGTFKTTTEADTWSELRYRHLVPDPIQWEAIEAGEPLRRGPKPTLVTDFYSYNTNMNQRNVDLTGRMSLEQESIWTQAHWVGDLTISARVRSEGGTGLVRFELIEGGTSNRAEIDVATGQATLFHGDQELGREPSALKGTGSHDVVFANVDNRLTLLVDGSPVFGEGVQYEDAESTHPAPTDEDLSPVRIAARGGSIAVSDLVLKRDIYYTLRPGPLDYGTTWNADFPQNPTEMSEFLANPARVAANGPLKWVDYPLHEDRFLMLGDNSPRSRDSRGWGTRDHAEGWNDDERESWEVPRKLLIGKAFCIYWPHGKPFGPAVQLWSGWPDFRFPFRPYFERMKWIR